MTAIIPFLFSPIGKVLLIGLALVSAVAYIDRRATYRERARCEARIVQSKIDATNADVEIARKAAAEAQKQAQELEAEKQVMEEENDELRKKIARLPVDKQCILPDRSKWLR